MRAVIGAGGGAVSALQAPAAPGWPGRALVFSAGSVFLAGFALLVAAATLLVASAELDSMFLPIAMLVYAGIAAVAIYGLSHHPFDRFGAPNIVTTIRVVATSLLAGLILDVGQIDGGVREPLAWLFAAIALLALLLDGIDGFLARRMRLSSAYGARYDMEIDALLILLLSVVAFGLGKAGAFVLAIGLMRYVYVAAQVVLPWLAGELPPSFRRKAVCVMQVVVLGALVTPLVQPPLSNIAALITVAFLSWSFALDIRWLYVRRARVA